MKTVGSAARGIALSLFLAASAYLVLELVIALSDQGQPTGELAATALINPVYPIWYLAPGLILSARIAMIVYPIAAAFWGIGWLMTCAARPVEAAPRRVEMPTQVKTQTAVEPAAVPEEAYVAVPEAVDDVCVIGWDRRIRHIGTSAARLFGLTPKDMLGTAFESFIAPSDLPKLDGLLATAHSERIRAVSGTIGIRHADGSLVQIAVTCTAGTAGPAGRPGTMIFTLRTLSERGQLEDQLAALWY